MPELEVIRPGDRAPAVASGAMRREAAVSGETVGAKNLWVGYVELDPRMVSAVHHHGESESVIYVISGLVRFAWGDDLSSVAEAEAGDFIWVPPHVVHAEINPSRSETTRTVVVRSTQEAIVVNLPAPENWEPPLD